MRPLLVLLLLLLAGLVGGYVGFELGQSAGRSAAEAEVVVPPTRVEWARVDPPPLELSTGPRESLDPDPGPAEEVEVLDDEVVRSSALAAWRERQAADREARAEQRQQEYREWTVQRATRFADELALAPGLERTIALILLEADERLIALRQEVSALVPGPASRERLQSGAAEVRAWRDQRFEQAFGPDLARQILAFEDGETTLGMSPEGPDDDVGRVPPRLLDPKR